MLAVQHSFRILAILKGVGNRGAWGAEAPQIFQV